jgi:hypothetical protein
LIIWIIFPIKPEQPCVALVFYLIRRGEVSTTQTRSGPARTGGSANRLLFPFSGPGIPGSLGFF